jgi:hypothetical protein
MKTLNRVSAMTSAAWPGGMRSGQVEPLDGVRDELAHRWRFDEFVAPLGVSEARHPLVWGTHASGR